MDVMTQSATRAHLVSRVIRLGLVLIGASWLAGCATGGFGGRSGRFPESRLETGRPRMFFRAGEWPGGYSLPEMRARAQADPFKDRVRSLRTTRANLALKWLLTGDEAAAAGALRELKALPGKLNTSSEGTDLVDAALAYDWLHFWPGFSAADRAEVGSRMLALAEQMRRHLEGEGAHPFHTRMYAWAAGVGMAGLALHGDQPEGAALFEFARRYYEQRLLPARQIQGGAMHNGLSYGLNYMMFPTVQFLKAARSAANVDYFHTADPADSEWLREMAAFLVDCVLPDMRHVPYADVATEDPAKHFRFMLDVLAAEYRDGQAAGLGQRISLHFKGSGYHAEWLYLFFSFHDPMVDGLPPDGLSLSRMYSPAGVGHVFLRSGWEADSTVVHFRCGDYFENHGHFDQGSFTLFRKGSLAMKTAGYWAFDSPYRHHYYKQALSANTVIFSDSADPTDEGRQRNIHFQSAETVENYLAHKRPGSQPNVETGNILAFNDPAWFSCAGGTAGFVAGEVTPAWDAGKVRRFVRQLALVDGQHLVVVDETETAAPAIRARWLLHTQAEPVRPPAATGEVWTASLKDSVLWVQPVLPAKPKVTLVGGEGHECEVNGVNHPYTGTDKFIKSHKGQGALRALPQYGLWRMELEHPEPAAKRLFVVVLTAADPGQTPPAVSARRVGGRLAVKVGAAEVTFKNVGGDPAPGPLPPG